MSLLLYNKKESIMSRLCPECEKGTLIIDGAGTYKDTILVHCNNCDADFELEPDGFGEGGMELAEAFLITGYYDKTE